MHTILCYKRRWWIRKILEEEIKAKEKDKQREKANRERGNVKSCCCLNLQFEYMCNFTIAYSMVYAIKL